MTQCGSRALRRHAPERSRLTHSTDLSNTDPHFFLSEVGRERRGPHTRERGEQGGGEEREERRERGEKPPSPEYNRTGRARPGHATPNTHTHHREERGERERGERGERERGEREREGKETQPAEPRAPKTQQTPNTHTQKQGGTPPPPESKNKMRMVIDAVWLKSLTPPCAREEQAHTQYGSLQY